MPVRVRITLLFTLLVFIILGLVCISVYYFSQDSRLEGIKTRLTNRALTTARLLSHAGSFDHDQIERIDSLTTLTLKKKSVAAFDYQNSRIYNYSDLPGDTVSVSKSILDEARVSGSVYFQKGLKEAVAYHYADTSFRVVMVAAGEDEEGRRTLYRLSQILLLSFLGGLIITFTCGYIFSGRLLHPLKKIADDVNEISAQDFTRRISAGKAKDEWYYLSRTINDLLNRLQESFEMQKRFIANASHELSTPLTSISSQLEVSLQKERAADEYRNVMKSIYQDVKQMGKLTQTLLEFAKASGNPAGLELNSIRIDEILLRLPASILKSGADYSVSLNFDDLPEEENYLHVYGNEELLFTAIRNIVINACKYSPDHHAGVRLSPDEQFITIRITDKGPGIPEDETEKIFQPFYRSGDNRTEGFGLGLPLANRIVRLHRGIISVKSVEGKGTEFKILLPTISKYDSSIRF
jgi:signal transduction histidine kinase